MLSLCWYKNYENNRVKLTNGNFIYEFKLLSRQFDLTLIDTKKVNESVNNLWEDKSKVQKCYMHIHHPTDVIDNNDVM